MAGTIPFLERLVSRHALPSAVRPVLQVAGAMPARAAADNQGPVHPALFTAPGRDAPAARTTPSLGPDLPPQAHHRPPPPDMAPWPAEVAPPPARSRAMPDAAANPHAPPVAAPALPAPAIPAALPAMGPAISPAPPPAPVHAQPQAPRAALPAAPQPVAWQTPPPLTAGATGAAQGPAAAPQPPVVHVSIDRIDLRITAAPAPAAAVPRPRAASTVSLADYLRRSRPARGGEPR